MKSVKAAQNAAAAVRVENAADHPLADALARRTVKAQEIALVALAKTRVNVATIAHVVMALRRAMAGRVEIVTSVAASVVLASAGVMQHARNVNG